MESDIREDHEEQMSSDLARYRSAPSSYFSGFAEDCGLERVEYEEYLHNRQSSPETDGIMARFMSEESTQTHYELQSRNSYSRSSPTVYQVTARPPLPSQNPPCSSSEVKVSYGAGEGSNLIRHTSSSAGFMTNTDTHKGYGVIRGIGSRESNPEAAFSPGSRFRGQISFSSIPPSSSEPSASSGQGTYQSVPVCSWEVPSIFSEDFSHVRRAGEEDKTKFSCLDSSEAHIREPGSHSHHALLRHSSLPATKTSVDMAAVDGYFQFHDSVPCKVRAKRGCATHPRSIAERVRRTRISERMRKLQELVPNMDKQTSTADMLDLAVDYIKDLQKQVKILSDSRGRCTCLDAHSIIQAPT